MVSSLSHQEFWSILQVEDFRELFFDYLIRKRCPENLLFYEAVKRWQNVNLLEEQQQKAVNLFNTFISDKACSQVNISGPTVRKIKAELNNASLLPPDDKYNLSRRNSYCNSMSSGISTDLSSSEGITLSSLSGSCSSGVISNGMISGNSSDTSNSEKGLMSKALFNQALMEVEVLLQLEILQMPIGDFNPLRMSLNSQHQQQCTIL